MCRCGIALLLRLAGLARAEPAQLQLVTEERPPRQMMHGEQVVGLLVEKVEDLMQKRGIRYQIQLYPFARAFMLALKTPNTCIFSIARTPERESQFVWIEPPLEHGRWVLFARGDNPIQLKTLADAMPYSIGTYNGDSRDTYLKEHGFQVDTAPSDQVNIRKLQEKRIDFWATDETTGHFLLAQSGMTLPVQTALVFKETNIYLACNPKTDPALLDRLRSGKD